MTDRLEEIRERNFPRIKRVPDPELQAFVDQHDRDVVWLIQEVDRLRAEYKDMQDYYEALLDEYEKPREAMS